MKNIKRIEADTVLLLIGFKSSIKIKDTLALNDDYTSIRLESSIDSVNFNTDGTLLICNFLNYEKVMADIQEFFIMNDIEPEMETGTDYCFVEIDEGSIDLVYRDKVDNEVDLTIPDDDYIMDYTDDIEGIEAVLTFPDNTVFNKNTFVPCSPKHILDKFEEYKQDVFSVKLG